MQPKLQSNQFDPLGANEKLAKLDFDRASSKFHKAGAKPAGDNDLNLDCIPFLFFRQELSDRPQLAHILAINAAHQITVLELSAIAWAAFFYLVDHQALACRNT